MAQALTIASTAMQALGAIRQGQAERAAANFNAQVAERNAAIVRDQTKAAQMAQRREAGKALGRMRAGYAASGVSLEGTALDVLEESVAQAELERQNIGYQGALRVQGYEADAALSRANGRNAAQRGYMNAASALLSGGAKVMGGAGGQGGFNWGQ